MPQLETMSRTSMTENYCYPKIGESIILVTLLLAAWGAAGAQAASVPASVPSSACDLPENAPERLVLLPMDLPVLPTPLAAAPSFPTVTVVGLGIFLETALLLAVGVFLSILAYRFRRRSAKIRHTPSRNGAIYASSSRADRRTTWLWVAAAVVLVLFADHAFRASATTIHLRQAQTAVHQSHFNEASARVERIRRLQEISPLAFLTPGFDIGLERIDTQRLAEIVGIHAVYQGLETSPTVAEEALSSFVPLSADAVAIANAVLSRRAWELLQAGEPEKAFQRSMQSRELNGLDPQVQANLCATRYHLALYWSEHQRFADALALAQALDPPACRIHDKDRAILHGIVARREAENHLMAKPARTGDAAAAVERAYRLMTGLGINVAFITCDVAAALEPHALALLAADRPEDSVATLERTDALVPGREFVQVSLPKALWSLGAKHLGENRYDDATTALQRAYDMPYGRDDKDVLDMLTLAHFSKGSYHFEAGDLDLAIHAMSQAHALKKGDRDITRALADAHLARADQSMRTGNLAAIDADLDAASPLTPRGRRGADMRRRIATGTNQRLSSFTQSAEWLRSPKDFVGEVPKDVDDDGVADGVVYYRNGETVPAGIGYLSERTGLPEAVLLLNEDHQVVAALRDNDLDGTLDERIDYSGEQLVELVVDSDRDDSPDVLMTRSFGETEMVRQFLSGRVLMRFKSGVVGAVVDPFTDSDTYIKLFRNYSFVNQTETVLDSNFPIWRRALAVEYKAGDVFRLEAWDEDVFFDDMIDFYKFHNYPTSGIYRFDRGRVALEIDVQPTDLPQGHVLWDEAPSTSNIFRDNPTAVPQVADLVAGAHRAREIVRLSRWVARQLVMTLLVRRLIPFENKTLRYITEIVIENAIVEPLLPE